MRQKNFNNIYQKYLLCLPHYENHVSLLIYLF